MIRRHDNFTSRLLEPKNIALGVLVAIAFFSLLFSPVRGALTQIIYKIAPAIWEIGDTGSSVFNSFIINFRDKDSLATENETLHATIDHMQAEALDRNLLAERVGRLEESLGREQSDNRVVGYVFVGPSFSPYDTLVIDVGSENGVMVGNMVVYAGAGAIGDIVEVSNNSSKVKLFSSSGEEHLMIVGPHSIPVKALGKGMGNFEAKVPQDSAVNIGDNVVSLKGDLIFGKVSFIEEKPAEPFKRLFFRTPFNISEIRSVEVIVDNRS